MLALGVGAITPNDLGESEGGPDRDGAVGAQAVPTRVTTAATHLSVTSAVRDWTIRCSVSSWPMGEQRVRAKAVRSSLTLGGRLLYRVAVSGAIAKET